MIKKLLIVLIAGVLVTLAVVKLAHNKKQINKETSYKEIIENVPVNVLTAQTMSLDDQLNFVGIFRASKEATVSSEAAGKIVAVYATEGQYIKEGQVIAVLDKTLLELQLLNNEAQYTHSREELARYENLIKRDATTDVTLKQMRLNNTVNEIAVGNTKEQLARCNIKSPISGFLVSKSFENGMIVSPGVTIGQMVDVATLKFTTTVPEYQVVKFKLNQKVNILADVYPNIAFAGTITQIGEKGDDNHNYKVEAAVINNKSQYPLRAAMNGSMYANGIDKKTGIFVPREALVGTAAKPQVYLAMGKTAILKDVSVSGVIGNMVGISKGIDLGERILVTGLNNLKDSVSIVVTAAR